MPEFQPDGLFLKRSGDRATEKVLQYNDASTVEAHVEHGYLARSSVEDDLDVYKRQECATITPG